MTQLINLLALVGVYAVMFVAHLITRRLFECYAASKKRRQAARDAVMRKASEEWYAKEFPSA